jgi:hypothetical protein
MRRLLVAYTTYDGHTAKIAERIARVTDCAVDVCDLARIAAGATVGRVRRSDRWRAVVYLANATLLTCQKIDSAYWRGGRQRRFGNERAAHETSTRHSFCV